HGNALRLEHLVNVMRPVARKIRAVLSHEGSHHLLIKDVEAPACSSLVWNAAKLFFATDPPRCLRSAMRGNNHRRFARVNARGAGSALAARTVDVKDRIDGQAHIGLTLPASCFRCGNQTFDILPFSVGQVARVKLVTHPAMLPKPAEDF